MNAEKSTSTGLDWILFLVSAAVLIAMLVYLPQWFWLALPFTLTYLAKAFRAM